MDNNLIYRNVTRTNDNYLLMAYYFPQFHICPENRMNINGKDEFYTDWDLVKTNNRSFTPTNYYNLSDESIINSQDERAQKYKIGVFIFYHYWLDNTMVLNLPIDLFIQKKRNTKFILCWDNESGFLGKQYYDSPEKHAYQLLRYFLNENYLTDKDGRKPFIIYLTPEVDLDYLNKFLAFLKLYNIDIKLGHNYQLYKNNWEIPNWSEIACEFAPHTHNVPGQKRNYDINLNRKEAYPNIKEHWQGILTSWDSRPRANSSRTHQTKCSNNEVNGCVNIDDFHKQLVKVRENITDNNSDKIITIFAWNEWSEGATLEESVEFGNTFIEKL